MFKNTHINNAKNLFNILNTNKSNNGEEVLDAEEQKNAKQAGLFSQLLNFNNAEEITEKEFIARYIEVAEQESCNDIRQQKFEEQCKNVKICYEELNEFKKAQIGLENDQEPKEMNVSVHTIMKFPQNGMYTMQQGYKILVKNNLYTCPEHPEWGEQKNIYGIIYEINSGIRDKKMQNLREALDSAKKSKDKENIMKKFLDDLHNWHSDFQSETYRINNVRIGKHIRKRVAGYDIYFVIEKNYKIEFEYDMIYEQLR